MMMILNTIREAVQLTGLSDHVLRTMSAEGRFPGIVNVPGRAERCHFIRDDVLAFMEERAVKSAVLDATGKRKKGKPVKVPAPRGWWRNQTKVVKVHAGDDFDSDVDPCEMTDEKVATDYKARGNLGH